MAKALIPRRTLLGNPMYSSTTISPDGNWLSWNAPFEGVLNIWIAPTDNINAAEPLTRLKGRPIWWHLWTGDSRYLLYWRDENGDENGHVFAVDRKSGSIHDLTPFDHVSARISRLTWRDPERVVLGLNNRDSRWHDLHLIDLSSGKRELIFENHMNYSSMQLDDRLTLRLAQSEDTGGGRILWRIDAGKVEEVMRVDHQDAQTFATMGIEPDGKSYKLLSTVGHNTSGLLQVDWDTGRQTEIVRDKRFDLDDFLLHPITNELLAAGVRGKRREWIYLAARFKDDFQWLKKRLTGFDFQWQGLTLDENMAVIMAEKPQQGPTFFLFNLKKRQLDELFHARPEMKNYRLAPMQAIEGRSRDGLDLHSLLTLPRTVRGRRPKKPMSMVLVVHGGPWGRDYYGYNRFHQWMADRGYAVLSVNYRGSTGFGKAFTKASEKEHARKMHDDLIDMVNWAIKENIANPKKIAIMGASYGGYASFVGATFTPDVFCCAVPVVGITNLQTLMETIPPYWENFKQFMYRSYGDPGTEEGRKLLAERSPIHKVDLIKIPLLIFHGQNDVRCKVAESETIVAAMITKKIPVGFVIYPDEGHGFQKPENDLSFHAMAEYFLAQHLGGNFEPYGEDLEGSSYEIRVGADLVGLTQSLL